MIMGNGVNIAYFIDLMQQQSVRFSKDCCCFIFGKLTLLKK